jgi:hypothetical protein
MRVNDDSRTGSRRQNAAVDRIETVPMTAEQYDQAVNALATLIVEWMTVYVPDKPSVQVER